MQSTTSFNSSVSYQTYGSLALKPSPLVSFTVVSGEKEAPVERSEKQNNREERSQKTFSEPKAEQVRQMAIVMLTVTLFFSIAGLGDALRAHHRDQILSRVGVELIEVMPGDSLWGISEAHSVVGVSTEDVMSWIVEKNGLTSSMLYAGDTVMVPVS